MGNLLEYSGIVTKIRAMEAKLLTPEQFAEIANMSAVPEIAGYLKKNTAYADALNTLEESQLHRGNRKRALLLPVPRVHTNLQVLWAEAAPGF